MKDWKGPVCLFGAFTLAGTSVISAGIVSGKLGSFTITAASLFFALLFLLPVCGGTLITEIKLLSAKDYLSMAIQSLCGILLFRLFLLSGLRLTSAGEAGIMTGATPAFTAILAMVLLKESINGKKLAGTLSTIAGILLIQGLFDNNLVIDHFIGNLLVLCAALCEALFNVFSRLFAVKTNAHRHTLQPMVQTTIVSAIGLFLCLIPVVFENPVPLLSCLGTREWMALVWYGLFVTALAFMFWYEGIRRCGAFTAAAFSGMMPFTSMLLSMFILGERIGWHQWLGGILVINGMILIGRARPLAKTSLQSTGGLAESASNNLDL